MSELKLWLISQDDNDGYDTYDSAVVAAETEKDARETHPCMISNALWVGDSNRGAWVSVRKDGSSYEAGHGWTIPERVSAVQIGVALPHQERAVICASFNAG